MSSLVHDSEPLLKDKAAHRARTAAYGGRPRFRLTNLLALVTFAACMLVGAWYLNALPVPDAQSGSEPSSSAAHASDSIGQSLGAVHEPGDTDQRVVQPARAKPTVPVTPALDADGLPLRVKSSYKAAWVMLVDPREDPETHMLKAMRSVEEHYGVFEHDWLFCTEKAFSDAVKAEAERIAPGRVHWAKLDLSVGWGVPDWISKEQVAEWQQSFRTPSGGGFRLAYKIFCRCVDTAYRPHARRWFSGFAYSHPALAGYDYLWRVDTDAKFDCSSYDPIQFMAERNLSYGFHRSRPDQFWTMPSLGATLDDFLRDHPDFTPRNEQFIRRPDGSYNGLAFTNNFEIISKRWFESEDYRTVFNYLDRNRTGFFSERWGDAPVRALIASLTLRPDQVAWFGGTLGYRHGMRRADWVCPAQSSPFFKYCDCDPKRYANRPGNSLDWFDGQPPVQPTIPWT